MAKRTKTDQKLAEKRVNPSPPDNPRTCTRNQMSCQFSLEPDRRLIVQRCNPSTMVETALDLI